MQKLSRIVILIIVAFLCALWSPWNAWNFNLIGLLGVKDEQSVSNLQVSSLAGELQVFVDDESEPRATATPDNSTVVPGISIGSHQIRLVRVSEVENAYWTYNKVIEFVAGVDVILAYELGPTEEFSGGHLIYADSSQQETTSSTVELTVSANVDSANVVVNDLLIGETLISSFELPVDEQQRLTISKPGYEKQQFLLFPESLDDRQQLAGLDLFVEVDLFLQPLEVEKL